MPQNDWITLMWMGGGFIIIGLGAIIWGRLEEKGYYNSLSGRGDEREFLDHWPPRPQLGALKIGGRIAIIIGIFMLAAGLGLRLWT